MDGDGGAGALMLGYAKTWWPFCPSPTAVNGLRGRPILKVACGEVHSVAATIDGEVLVWGLASTPPPPLSLSLCLSLSLSLGNQYIYR